MSAAVIDLFHPVKLPEMEVAALDVMRSGQIASGPKVSQFERAFATISGREHVVSTNDLTSAVTLALHLAGVRVGDEVATVAFSCLQSNSPIARLGAYPVWIDIDPSTMSMSVDDLAAKLRPSVKAVMVYHIAGYPADSFRISNLCRKHGIPLIEDCNNAIGASINGKPLGLLGDYAVYSFYPNRQINGIDGGMLAVPDEEVASRATRLRRFGIDPKSFRDVRGEINPESDVSEIGWSAALGNLNSAIALAQLSTLSQRTDQTLKIATELINRLRNIRPVGVIPNGIPAFWGLLIQSDRRDELLSHLKARGIKSSILHQRNDCYTGFGVPRADLPGTAKVMEQMLALPCGWWLNKDDIDRLVNQLSSF
jgi:dTDP-4-amino-4,6-dideoxygalactose transaminase